MLEDLVLADQQLSIECNSVTDNPLVRPDGAILHGGNFQARAVTAAMEKARQGLQTIGRMLFAQCTELMNPATSKGLPPNLAADDAADSFMFKATDINAAALAAELGFLAGPVNHVQTAEMGNQSINSLALISARYTHTAVDVLSQLAAAHLVAVCQALDLRAMHRQYFDAVRQPVESLVGSVLLHSAQNADEAVSSQMADLISKLWELLVKGFEETFILRSEDRFAEITKSLGGLLLESVQQQSVPEPLDAVCDFTKQLEIVLRETWVVHRDAYFAHGNAAHYLGEGSKCMYSFVRDELGVRFLHAAQIATPKPEQSDNIADHLEPLKTLTVGDSVRKVYEAIRDGTMAKFSADILGVV